MAEMIGDLLVTYRAARLAGAWAGALAAIGLVLSANWVRELSHGYSEPFTIGLLLAAADAHLSGRRRTAIVLGGLVSLARPEALALVCLYGVVLWRRGGRALLLLRGTVTCVLALWLVPDWIGWATRSTRARSLGPSSPAGLPPICARSAAARRSSRCRCERSP